MGRLEMMKQRENATRASQNDSVFASARHLNLFSPVGPAASALLPAYSLIDIDHPFPSGSNFSQIHHHLFQ